MPLKSLMIKGKEYHANKITKIVMEEGTVSIMYIPNAMSRERKITAKFKDVEFVNKDNG